MVTDPGYIIVINGNDKTSVIHNKLISLTLTDNANNESDELEIVVSGNFIRPAYEDQIKIFFGYGTDVQFMGLFNVQSTSKTFTQLSIKATGIDFSDNFKVKRNITYEKLSLKQLANQIADRHSLKLKSDFDDIYLLSQSQSNESDMHFLNRLAKEYNALFNIKNDTLYFVKKIKENKKNDDLPKYSIDVNYCTDISIEQSNKTSYNSCEVSWHDTKENKTFTKVYPPNGGEPILKFKGSFKNEAHAMERAKAQLQKANQGLISGNLRKSGDVIFAGGILTLLNNIDQDEEEYQITRVTHNLDKQSGWITSLEFEK